MNGRHQNRTILSEYHDGGAITGMFMIRNNHWKYIYYPGYPPQLFDLQNDPMERNDLGRNQAYAQIVAECHAALCRIVDPDAANQREFNDQAKKIDALGGRNAILALEDFDFTPMPKFS